MLDYMFYFVVVVDGDDMSSFDSQTEAIQNAEDEDSLDQLEWELASQTGQVTGTILPCLLQFNMVDVSVLKVCLIIALNPYSAGIDFSPQNLTSVDVKF